MSPYAPIGPPPRSGSALPWVVAALITILAGSALLVALRPPAPPASHGDKGKSAGDDDDDSVEKAGAKKPKKKKKPAATPGLQGSLTQLGGPIPGASEGIALELKHDGKPYVAVYDALSGVERWRFRISDANDSRSVMQVVGAAIVDVDARGNLHVFEASSGKETARSKLTDVARWMCATNGGKAVYVAVADRHDVIVDLASGTSTPAATPPAGCFDSRDPLWAQEGHAKVPAVAGVDIDRIAVAGAIGVARGKKSPGTPTSIAIGYDATTLKVTWQHVIPVDPFDESTGFPGGVCALSGSIFLTSYMRSFDVSRLVGFDARSGDRKWEVELPKGAEGLVVSATYVYVAYYNALEVRTTIDGKVVTKL